MTNPKKISNWRIIRNRLIAGLFVVLPFFITYIVLKWLYDTLISYAIGPIANWLIEVWYPSAVATAEEPSHWLINLIASFAAFGLVLGLLFIAGMFFRSRIHSWVDWFFSNVPGVSTVYKAVSDVFDAISRTQGDGAQFKRVVLVQFPHPGMRVPAFVTSECVDINTGREILCVYVPTTPVPTSGYMLLVPEEEVIAVNWDLQETLQAIVSGGITVPRDVIYDQPKSTSIVKKPISDQLTSKESSVEEPNADVQNDGQGDDKTA